MIMFRISLILGVVFLPRIAAADGAAFTGQTMGTSYAVTLAKSVGGEKIGALKAKTDALLKKFSGEFSTYDPSSLISRFNQTTSTEPVPVSRSLAVVAKLATEVSQQTGGAFDPTVAPLLKLWGFGPGAAARSNAPAQRDIDAVLAVTGTKHFRIRSSPPSLQKAIPEVKLDLSAIAKGYGVDEVGRMLEAEGIADYLVDIGGELRARGRNSKGDVWLIGVAVPDKVRSDFDRVVSLPNMSIATSGDYEKYIEVGGQRIAHIIDPRSGRPIAHKLASATVITQDCAQADAYATALMVAGEEDAKRMASRLKFAALLIVRDGEGFVTWASDGWPGGKNE